MNGESAAWHATLTRIFRCEQGRPLLSPLSGICSAPYRGPKKRIVADPENGFKYVVHINLRRGSFVPKVAMSFEKTKKSLVRRMTKKSGKTVVVEFKNDDVPTFLRNLDEFEKVSKKCRVMVK
jgi:hypothetical protein